MKYTTQYTPNIFFNLPLHPSYHHTYSIGNLHDDRKAVENDWRKVGDDMTSAISLYEENGRKDIRGK